MRKTLPSCECIGSRRVYRNSLVLDNLTWTYSKTNKIEKSEVGVEKRVVRLKRVQNNQSCEAHDRSDEERESTDHSQKTNNLR